MAPARAVAKVVLIALTGIGDEGRILDHDVRIMDAPGDWARVVVDARLERLVPATIMRVAAQLLSHVVGWLDQETGDLAHAAWSSL
jgi:hypothetical protein